MLKLVPVPRWVLTIGLIMGLLFIWRWLAALDREVVLQSELMASSGETTQALIQVHNANTKLEGLATCDEAREKLSHWHKEWAECRMAFGEYKRAQADRKRKSPTVWERLLSGDL